MFRDSTSCLGPIRLRLGIYSSYLDCSSVTALFAVVFDLFLLLNMSSLGSAASSTLNGFLMTAVVVERLVSSCAAHEPVMEEQTLGQLTHFAKQTSRNTQRN
jgi:hypothetical protein